MNGKNLDYEVLDRYWPTIIVIHAFSWIFLQELVEFYLFIIVRISQVIKSSLLPSGFRLVGFLKHAVYDFGWDETLIILEFAPVNFVLVLDWEER